MDIKSLTAEELDDLSQQIATEVENRRAAAAAPLLIQQTALRAMAVGATGASLQEALELVTNPPPPVEEPVEEETPPIPEEPTESVDETPVEPEPAPDEPVVDPESPVE